MNSLFKFSAFSVPVLAAGAHEMLSSSETRNEDGPQKVRDFLSKESGVSVLSDEDGWATWQNTLTEAWSTYKSDILGMKKGSRNIREGHKNFCKSLLEKSTSDTSSDDYIKAKALCTKSVS